MKIMDILTLKVPFSEKERLFKKHFQADLQKQGEAEIERLKESRSYENFANKINMKPRFKIQPIKRTTSILKRQRYYFRIESNYNGQLVVWSEKYTNKDHRDEMMNALKTELYKAEILPEIDMD